MVRPLFFNTRTSWIALTVGLSFAIVSCNKPPTRAYIVKSGAGDSNPEVPDPEMGDPEEGESEGTLEAPETSDPAEGEPAEKPKSEEPVTNKPDPEKPKTEEPVVVKPVPEMPKPEEPKKLVECPNNLSVGRIYQWHATQEGTMVPQSGLIVVKENGQNVAKVEFVGEGWHVVPVWLKNAYEAEVDLSKSKNFTITYSATADLFVQLRPAFAWSGGDKWAAKIPSTGGSSKTLTVSFEDAAQWTAPLGQPPHSLNEARAKARGFVFIGNKPAKFAVTSLLIDGYEPPCP